MLGAARIGPAGLVLPAKSHAEAVVVAVASRDAAKVNAYAKRHGIPRTYDGTNCYESEPDLFINLHTLADRYTLLQGLLKDPEVDAVYIAVSATLRATLNLLSMITVLSYQLVYITAGLYVRSITENMFLLRRPWQIPLKNAESFFL